MDYSFLKKLNRKKNYREVEGMDVKRKFRVLLNYLDALVTSIHIFLK